MLLIENLSKSYRDHLVLDNISFQIEEGKICGLFGRNGAGKSTLLKILSGLEQKDGGRMTYDGRDFEIGKYPIISSMIESPSFFPEMTGYENLMLLKDLCEDITPRDVLLALKKVGLGEKKDTLVRKYSLGMKQRLYFAFALMRKADIYLLDEPFNGIDPIALDSFEKIVKDLASAGKTILISSHEIRELQALVTKGIFLDEGRIVYTDDDPQNHDIFQEFLTHISSSLEAQ